MRDITIICVGKLKQAHKYIQHGLSEYDSRLKNQFKIKWVEVKDYAPSDTREVEWVFEQEANEISKYLHPNAYTILLSERGDQLDSEQFAHFLFSEDIGLNPPHRGGGPQANQPIIFIIGGAFGTAPKLLAESNRVISLSKLTFAHPLVRLILAEQLYRSWMIAQNRPYHK